LLDELSELSIKIKIIQSLTRPYSLVVLCFRPFLNLPFFQLSNTERQIEYMFYQTICSTDFISNVQCNFIDRIKGLCNDAVFLDVIENIWKR
jgi:hypothetical protein